MPVLPSIRPVSPLSSSVTVQAHGRETDFPTPEKKKLGRQLSLASHGNHYNDIPSSNISGLSSPTGPQKESFFSHLRKKARRFSGRNQGAQTPQYDDATDTRHSGYGVTSNRSSMLIEPIAEQHTHYAELDKALQRLEHGLDQPQPSNQLHRQASLHLASAAAAKPAPAVNYADSNSFAGPVSSRTRRALHASSGHPATKYETPDEQDELLDEAIHGVQRAVKRLDKQAKHSEAFAVKDTNRLSLRSSVSIGSMNPYPTPSPSAKRNGVLFNQTLMNEPVTAPINIARNRQPKENTSMWPTPPHEENEWAASAAASIWAAGSAYR